MQGKVDHVQWPAILRQQKLMRRTRGRNASRLYECMYSLDRRCGLVSAMCAFVIGCIAVLRFGDSPRSYVVQRRFSPSCPTQIINIGVAGDQREGLNSPMQLRPQCQRLHVVQRCVCNGQPVSLRGVRVDVFYAKACSLCRSQRPSRRRGMLPAVL
jgi:hypothetical protein